MPLLRIAIWETMDLINRLVRFLVFHLICCRTKSFLKWEKIYSYLVYRHTILQEFCIFELTFLDFFFVFVLFWTTPNLVIDYYLFNCTCCTVSDFYSPTSSLFTFVNMPPDWYFWRDWKGKINPLVFCAWKIPCVFLSGRMLSNPSFV